MVYGAELYAAGFIPKGVEQDSITPMSNPKGVAFSFIKETPGETALVGYQFDYHIKCRSQLIYIDGGTFYYNDGSVKSLPSSKDGQILLRNNYMYPMYLKYCTK